MEQTLNIALLFLLTLMAIWAVMATRLLYAAVGLALCSVALAIVMFRMDSPLAAVIELSVCAGLITAIFISVISLVKHSTQEEIVARSRVRLKKYIWLPLLVLVLGAALALLAKPHALPLPSIPPETDVRDVFWHLRQADLVGQILLVLAGAYGIVVLFKGRTKK
jgi:NADH-quinone oxidoreductase subunit J